MTSPGPGGAAGGDPAAGDARAPALSLVLPCYNEADCLHQTVPALAAALAAAAVDVELVLVDNGSTDGTSGVIDELMARGLPITKGRVAHNEGQGLGLITGLGLARGRFVGCLPADGQIAPPDVVRIYQRLASEPEPALVKGRRVRRRDGLSRAIVSTVYNAVMQILFPGMPSRDVNCPPKMMPAGIMRLIDPRSKDWFLEAEFMIKARHLGLPIVEIPIAGLPREAGSSHVRVATVLEFLRNLLVYRFTPEWRAWRARVARGSVLAPRR